MSEAVQREGSGSARSKTIDPLVVLCWILAILLPFIGPIIAAMLEASEGRRKLDTIVGMAFLAFVLQFVWAQGFHTGSRAQPRAKEAALKTSLQNIGLALEEYARGHQQHYPEEIEELVSSGALEEFYSNPFQFSRETGKRPKMRHVPFGSLNYAGNFSYLPLKNEGGEVVSFLLLGYGYRGSNGLDIDGDGRDDKVIFAMRSGGYCYNSNDRGRELDPAAANLLRQAIMHTETDRDTGQVDYGAQSSSATNASTVSHATRI